MNRPLVTLGVLFFALIAQPQTAFAWGFWAWLEEWSGPGPFKARRFRTQLFTMCVQDKTLDDRNEGVAPGSRRFSLKPSPIALNDKFHWDQVFLAKYIRQSEGGVSERLLLKRLLANPLPLDIQQKFPIPSVELREKLEQAEKARTAGTAAPALPPFNPELKPFVAAYTGRSADRGPGHTDQRLICGFVDHSLFEAPPNPARDFPAMSARLIDFGPSARLHDGVDLGGGFGVVKFDGDFPETEWRLTITPIRLVLRPALLALPEEWRKKWMGVFSIYWKETYIGSLTGKDFGIPEDRYRSNGELVRSFGVNLDLTALLPASWGIR